MVMAPPEMTTGKKWGSIIATASQPQFQEVMRRANELYSHWHRFRYYPIPEGLTHEELWGYIRLGRTLISKFVPALVDKEGRPFSYLVNDFIQRELHEIDLWSGGNITTDSPDGLPGKERYIIRSLMDEAIASSQLEGADTTTRVAKELLRSGREPKDKSEQMILNNWKGMQFIREHRKQPLTPELIGELHAVLTENTLNAPSEAGTLRTKDDDIVIKYRGKTVHEPPKAGELSDRIASLCDFANKDLDGEKWIHPVIKSAMIHFYLAYIHPFIDGNGRTARALMYWYLLSRDYLLFEYIAISRYIIRAPGQYVNAYLFTETDSNDLTYFLIYNLKAVRNACEDLKTYIRRKQQETTRANALLKKYRGLNLRQKSLVYHAIRHANSSYTIESHKNVHGIVYQTARADLLSLVKMGFLKKAKEGKEFVFFPSERVAEKLKVEENKVSAEPERSV